MLVSLRIQNMAIIDSVFLEFHPGFNVLTGETGAGKSNKFRPHPASGRGVMTEQQYTHSTAQENTELRK